MEIVFTISDFYKTSEKDNKKAGPHVRVVYAHDWNIVKNRFIQENSVVGLSIIIISRLCAYRDGCSNPQIEMIQLERSPS